MMTQTVSSLYLGLDHLPSKLAASINFIAGSLLITSNRYNEPRCRWQVEDSYFIAGTQLDEKEYLDEMSRAQNDEQRLAVCTSEISFRTRHVGNMLKAHELAVRRQQLQHDLALLTQQAAAVYQSQPHPTLRSALISLAQILQTSSGRFTPEQALERIGTFGGTSTTRLLQAVHILYRQTRLSLGPFPHFSMPLFRFDGMPQQMEELFNSFNAAKAALRDFEEPLGNWRRASHDFDLGSAVYAMELGLVGMNESGGKPDWTFEQMKARIDNNRATGYAAQCLTEATFKRVVEANLRLHHASEAVRKALLVLPEEWELRGAMKDPKQILTYKAMINCIAARYLADQIDKVLDGYQKFRTTTRVAYNDVGDDFVTTAVATALDQR